MPPASDAPVTQAVARLAACHDLTSAPAELLHRATRAFIDTIGVAVAGGGEQSFGILARTLETVPGASSVLPTGARTSAQHAALLNGTAGHALDYDDVADEIKGHPSVVLVSALLALAEATDATGRELLEAYCVGFEVACALAQGLDLEAHYGRGWHSTATLGSLAATAAAGRLLRLDELGIRHALGIAASMASGSRQNFGTMTKPLHAGLAARDAVTAAQLAANGFTADPAQLEGRIGFYRMYSHQPHLDAVPRALAEAKVLLARGLNVKKYPCCYGIHRAADAALAVFARGIQVADVQSVCLTLQPGGQEAIIHHRPTTGLQGKFSAEYVMAACLLDGQIRLFSFTDAAVCRPPAQDLLRRVTLHESPTPPFGPESFEHAYATLEIALADGSRVRERCDVPRGDARAPLSDAEVEAKFRDCMAFSGPDWDADRLLADLWRLEAASSAELRALWPAT